MTQNVVICNNQFKGRNRKNDEDKKQKIEKKEKQKKKSFEMCC